MNKLRGLWVIAGSAVAACSASTVTLQNGSNGYSGCTDAFVYNRHSSSTYIASTNEIAQGTRNFLVIEEDQA